MQELEEKYINLLIAQCLNLKKSKSVLINYHKENKPFINKLVKKLNELNIKDIYLDEEDPDEYHTLLTKDEKTIMESSYFKKDIWGKYAKKGANFLILKSEYPHMMDDLDIQKVTLASNLMLKSKKEFYDAQKKNLVPWCIAALPSKTWAEEIFPGVKDAYERLFKLIGSLVLLEEKDPIKAWDEIKVSSNKLIKKMNKLKIKTLHYQNNKGTDFKIDISKEALWCGVGTDVLCLVNLPSYEIFTSPLKDTAEGIVYGSKPLFYNNQKIDEFYLKFSKGVVVEYDAHIGKEVLESILNKEGMKNLGEIALVDKNSPIAKSGVALNTTLLDENASCHIALGEGFPECLKNGCALSDEKLKKKGLNLASNHVDMMIGTDDLNIYATTYDNKEIQILKNGTFII